MRYMLKYLGVTSLVVLLTVGTDSVAQTGANPPEPNGKVTDLRITDQDYALGPKDAKIVVVEYASLTCPHCAQFHTQVLPGLKKGAASLGNSCRICTMSSPVSLAFASRRAALAAALSISGTVHKPPAK